MTNRSIVLSIALAAFPLSLNAQERMKPGNWEVVYTGAVPHTSTTCTVVGADRTFVNTASYHGDTYESHIITKTGGKELITHQKGRRLGACP
jgi:hypothetical protein